MWNKVYTPLYTMGTSHCSDCANSIQITEVIRKVKLEVPCALEVLLLNVIQRRQITNSRKHLYPNVHCLYVQWLKNGNNLCPLMENGCRKLGHRYRNPAVFLNLEGIMFSEMKSNRERQINTVWLHLHIESLNIKLRNRRELMVARGGGWGSSDGANSQLQVPGCNVQHADYTR